jgi:hypothetical protein
MEIIVHVTDKHGVYRAYLGSTLLCTTRQPFFDGARALLRLGYNPDEALNMRHQGSARPSFKPTTIGKAAKLTIVENEAEGPKLVKHEANPFAEARRAEAERRALEIAV